MRLALIVLLLLFASCSANWHLKQADKHIKKAKLKDPTVSRVDTLYLPVEVITEHIRVDTTIIRESRLDTLKIETERIRVRYHYDTITNTEYLSGECLPDTIRVTVSVPQESLIIRESFYDGIGMRPWLFWLVVVVGLGVVTVLMARARS